MQAGEPQIGINQHFPDGVVYEAHPVDADVELNDLLRGVEVDLRALLKGKTTIILGVPGAYTPNCTQYHLPGYIDKFDAFKLAGADQIICLSANDVFVARSWAQALGAEGKVRVLAGEWRARQATHCASVRKETKRSCDASGTGLLWPRSPGWCAMLALTLSPPPATPRSSP